MSLAKTSTPLSVSSGIGFFFKQNPDISCHRPILGPAWRAFPNAREQIVDGFLQYLESFAAAQVELPTIGSQVEEDSTLSLAASKSRPDFDSLSAALGTLMNLGHVVSITKEERTNGRGNVELEVLELEILRRLVVILDRGLLRGPVSKRCEARHLDFPTQAKTFLASLRDRAAAQHQDRRRSSTDDLLKLIQEADRVMQGLVERYNLTRRQGRKEAWAALKDDCCMACIQMSYILPCC